ncbi:Two-component chemotaxis response transcriptional regulator cheY [Magnetospirillum molischianum DSM 120]|uniref:Two-component chemotaxis response transcriptional regulator cheY n=2 Tax=Magnetospirillum molischianum TaxID=1083 RepID=H8FVG3_MAGML|nr:Two-component chemotaxis response transcriptional regulator cheY [Magnetospirillum molischianum DSM 120]
MIIDDSPTMLMSLNGILSKAGLTVVQARNGEEALAILKGGSKPDLIVTDLNMGAMNGIELIRNIRKLSGLQFTPTIVLTTESQQDRRTEAKAAGATGWIVKPVEADALLQVVRQLVPGA